MSSTMFLLIKIGGLFNLALVVFHLLFWHIFDWNEDLRSLTFVNRAIMQVLNLSLTFVFAIFAYLSLVHTYELYWTVMGRSLLLFVSVLFILRALMQIIFFRLQHPASVALLVFFIAVGVVYGIPAISADRRHADSGFGEKHFGGLLWRGHIVRPVPDDNGLRAGNWCAARGG